MIATIISTLAGAFAPVISEFVEDKDKANELKFKLATMAGEQAHAEVMAVHATNQTEAAHKSLFVAGWRPFVGWICGVALAFNFVVRPMLDYALVAFGSGVQSPPPLDMSTMMPVLMGMLGLGGLRTYEKMKGVAREK